MATQWSVPKIWSGETAFILASGPSMSQEVADKVRGNGRVFAVNDQYKFAPWADVLYAADAKWWNVHWQEVSKLTSRKVTIIKDGSACKYDEVLCVTFGGYHGLDLRSTHIRTCKNSGFQALNLAVLFGCTRIILCGFDMRNVEGRDHWFGDHPKPLRCVPPFDTFINLIKLSVMEIERAGIEVINCTPGSALKCFKNMSLEKALESVRTNKRNAAISA